MKIKQWIVRTILIMILCVFGFGGWRFYIYETTPKVEMVYAEIGNLKSKVNASGYVEAEAAGTISSKVDGIVDALKLNVGNHVKKGDVVAVIDKRDILLELAQTKANLDVLKAEKVKLAAEPLKREIEQARIKLQQEKENIDHEQKNLDRYELLYKENAISQQEIENCRLQLDTAKNNYKLAQEQLNLLLEGPNQNDLKVMNERIKQAKVALEIAENKLSDTTIVSDKDGVAISKQAGNGMYVQTGTVLYQIADFSKLKVIAKVDEKDILNVSQGQKAAITGKTLAGREFTGIVVKIAPIPIQNNELDIDEVKYEVEIEIGSGDVQLKEGLTVNVDIITKEIQNALLVPFSSISEKNKEYFVFINDDGIATLRNVKIGSKNEKTVEIVSGIKEGDEVLANPPRTLLDKSRIRAIN